MNSFQAGQLNRLQTFALVAEKGAISTAAKLLCLTPSAVSHRIRHLERELNLPLFTRLHRKITLTAEGKRLFRIINNSFDLLSKELLDLKHQGVVGRITLYSRPSFAQAWLAPRLGDFLDRYPGIDVCLSTGNDLIQLDELGVDIAINFGHLSLPGLACTPLMNESMTPVCSAYYAEKFGLMNHPERLNECRLLHDHKAWDSDSGDHEWQQWTKAFDVSVSAASHLYCDQMELSVASALHHGGVAMGRMGLLEERLQSGSLVAPFPDKILASPYGYALYTQQGNHWPKVQLFMAWITEQARGKG
ncbi:DNA-binding transcriptional regulator DsdC [Rosenbergiella nectarea]|uniref:DNA-binding transcriptional regulator DsdC n=1 Tax=Rosenbergiella nectarea TaxID=988801 RepID=UPI00202502F8|nr:DNA-binding transcriptional regulator DsdC [Rosenbergiella nectarea]